MGFDMTNWQEHPCVVGRPADWQDVQENRATFYDPEASVDDVYSLACPMPAMLQSDGGRLPVLIVQAQYAPNGNVIVGSIDPLGRQYVSLLTELELSEKPTEEWISAVESSK